MQKYDIIVIGSGPAGLSAGYAAGLTGKRVLILEKMSDPGLKLLASGGGRCNVANILGMEDFAVRFGKNWRFMLPALQNFHGQTLLEFFHAHQVPLILSDGFHYFPESGKARDVLQLFLDGIARCKGTVKCGEKVTDIRCDRGWQVTAGRNVYRGAAVILACGGRGYPALGGSMAGYELAGKCGHKVTELFPAMTGVVCADARVGNCAGISLADCMATLELKGRNRISARGELLFTHRGFSAFAILDLAGQAAEALSRDPVVRLKIDFLPYISPEELHAEFAAWRQAGGKKHISGLLGKWLPKKAAQLLLDGDDPEISRWQAASSRKLAEKLKGSIFELNGVENWEKAMVTRGGVSLKEVDPRTLASKKIPGLFFAGEMLDITGPCGGFNISWALASGMLAGQSASSFSSSAATAGVPAMIPSAG
ncbi:MAG: aminoacetone oxidase family FAD-binding enzyme [Lentisphaerae bacterium]|nr:aminoacetone oxidase family FAD-binding enzyme [Lentisphaerota bacterium]